MIVGKRVVELAVGLFPVFEAVYNLASATVTDEVSGEYLVYYGNGVRLPPVLLLRKATHERLKIFC